MLRHGLFTVRAQPKEQQTLEAVSGHRKEQTSAEPNLAAWRAVRAHMEATGPRRCSFAGNTTEGLALGHSEPPPQPSQGCRRQSERAEVCWLKGDL